MLKGGVDPETNVDAVRNIGAAWLQAEPFKIDYGIRTPNDS